MKPNLAVVLSLVLLSVAPQVQAQAAPTPSTQPAPQSLGEHRHGSNWGGGARSFEAMDTNRDGFVTLDEWKAAGRREERFNEIDANHTGKITRDDLTAYIMKMREQRQQNGGDNWSGGDHDAH